VQANSIIFLGNLERKKEKRERKKEKNQSY
jgi:hypothetical protein